MSLNINPDEIRDLAGAREAIRQLLNLIETLSGGNRELREEVQRLRDEIARLKGEQGKPEIHGNKKERSDHSSEQERKAGTGSKERKGHSKVAEIEVDREEVIKVERSGLPEDAEFKGHEAVVVQDIVIKTDHVRFLKEKYYSASAGKTYLGVLPAGYEGQFGPGVRSWVITLYYAGGMSEPKIRELLSQAGVSISAGQVSNLLTQNTQDWEAEARTVLHAGLNSTTWQHIDDTPTRVDGVNHFCQILTNPYYSWYATRRHKNRLTVISVLADTSEPVYLLDPRTTDWLEKFSVPNWARLQLAQWPQGKLLSDEEIRCYLSRDLSGRLNEQQQSRILEAAALSAYYAQTQVPTIPILLSDDAGQFRYLTLWHGLCWIHEGRHYKKLLPCLPYHLQLLETFRGEFWAYYHQLQHYRIAPSPSEAERLQAEFVKLFNTHTGYDALDKCIAATLGKQTQLLTVLSHPEMPLHNNPAELAARQRVRKRDVSFGPRSPAGVKAWDTFMSLAETTKKLGVSFYRFVHDRISNLALIPPLADLIRARAAPA